MTTPQHLRLKKTSGRITIRTVLLFETLTQTFHFKTQVLKQDMGNCSEHGRNERVLKRHSRCQIKTIGPKTLGSHPEKKKKS